MTRDGIPRAGEAEAGTSLIASASRGGFVGLMKSYNGGTVPAQFGCTYCHSRVGNTAMREALSHFGIEASKHPVGYDFVGDTETDNEYLSTVGSTTANELDCVDCHSPALVDDPGVPTWFARRSPP